MSDTAPLPSDDPPPVKHTLTTAKFEAVNEPTATPTSAPTDVHQVLKDNLARENAAGMNVVKPVPKRPSRPCHGGTLGEALHITTPIMPSAEIFCAK